MLVDKAAVRDPSNPTEAQRFLLWKAEGADEGYEVEEDDDMTDTIEKIQAENEDLAKRVRILEKSWTRSRRLTFLMSACPPRLTIALTWSRQPM